MKHYREQVFEAPVDAVFDAVLSYMRGKPGSYVQISDDRAQHTIDAKLLGAFFAYNAKLHFVASAEGSGAKLTLELKTHPLFFFDPLQFWRRYSQRVFASVEALSRAA